MSSGELFGQSVVVAALASSHTNLPDVSIKLKIAQSMPSLVEEGCDLSIISATQLPDPVYISQTRGTALIIM
jgi:DNA-binding transcriptional LysR family regulator